jgi:hypothetical protein
MGSDDGDQNRERKEKRQNPTYTSLGGGGKGGGHVQSMDNIDGRANSVGKHLSRLWATSCKLKCGCAAPVAHLRRLFRHNFLLLLPEKLGPERVRGDTTNKSAKNFQPKGMRLNNSLDGLGWNEHTILPCQLRYPRRTISSGSRGIAT